MNKPMLTLIGGFRNSSGTSGRNLRSKNRERQRDSIRILAISSCHNISYSTVNKSNANLFIIYPLNVSLRSHKIKIQVGWQICSD